MHRNLVTHKNSHFLTGKKVLWQGFGAMSSKETPLAARAVDVPLFFNDNSLRTIFDIAHFSTLIEVGGALLPLVYCCCFHSRASRSYPYCIGHFQAAPHISHLACVESNSRKCTVGVDMSNEEFCDVRVGH